MLRAVAHTLGSTVAHCTSLQLRVLTVLGPANVQARLQRVCHLIVLSEDDPG